MTRPCIALDCDGVVMDFQAFCLAEINRQLGTSFTSADVTSWNHRECLGVDADRLTRDIVRDGRCVSDAEPYPGAAEQVARLADVYDVWIVTHMPREHHDRRRDWLDRHGFRVAGLISSEGRKSEDCRRLGAFAFADDKPANVRDVHAAGILSYLIAQRYNEGQAIPGVRRVTLEQMVNTVLLARQVVA